MVKPAATQNPMIEGGLNEQQRRSAMRGRRFKPTMMRELLKTLGSDGWNQCGAFEFHMDELQRAPNLSLASSDIQRLSYLRL
jgi:hypothetical protein